jgi:hypothetical protein
MRKSIVIFIVGLIPPVAVSAQDRVDVVAPQARMGVINSIKTLLTNDLVDDPAEDLSSRNPFNPVKPVKPVEDSIEHPASVLATPGSDRELLRKIADGITPSGTMQLGDVPILLFGQKKFKVGDSLTIIFEDNSYELQISAIERISFTLRLNNEEIIRPIKPVANKP